VSSRDELRDGQIVLPRFDAAAVFGIAVAVALVHIATNNRYGFHRDELQFLSDARHLDWGFVSYPPLTPFLEYLSLKLFGLSMVGLRLFSVLAQALVLVLTGLMTYQFGGKRLAQVTAVLAVALSPLPLFEGTEFQYTSFDYLWWVLCAYFVVRLLGTEDRRWWLAIGGAVGAGLMTKYTIGVLALGILCGFALTQRRYLLRNWMFVCGCGLAVCLALPNLVWQAHHGFVSYQFLRSIHERDIGWGRTRGFVWKQFVVCTNVYATPLWIAGLVSCWRSPRYRPVALMYLVPFAVLFLGNGIFYYLGAAYPMLFASGAPVCERWLASLSTRWRYSVRAIFFAALLGAGAYSYALVLPLASSGPLLRFALARNGDLREEFGWDDLVRTVAAIRDALPADRRADFGVVVGNYGEQGAIEILGPAYHLPPPISMTNSAWLRGYSVPPPSTLIVVGFSRKGAEAAFSGCRLAGHNGNAAGVENEESRYHPDIFLCGGPTQPWPEFWKEHQRFG